MLRDALSGAPQHEVFAYRYRGSPHAEEARLGRLEAWAVSLDLRALVLHVDVTRIAKQLGLERNVQRIVGGVVHLPESDETGELDHLRRRQM